MSESKIVYILTNPEMPGLVKIGATENLEEEVRFLSSHPGVPVPFEVHYSCEIIPKLDPEEVLKGLHDAFGDDCVNPSREFFKIDPKKVLSILKPMELKNAPGRGKKKKPRPPFKFSPVGIPEGSIIYFSLNTDITAKVVGDRKVEFEGKVTSLSSAAGEVLMRDHGWTHTDVQGPAFWLYENETLAERRDRLENRRKDIL